ncbi:MAG: hypothetical protein K0S65_6086, partial [Labilithrix sp.]|nr:hypothetical protein [Labilithrix sp.]
DLTTAGVADPRADFGDARAVDRLIDRDRHLVCGLESFGRICGEAAGDDRVERGRDTQRVDRSAVTAIRTRGVISPAEPPGLERRGRFAFPVRPLGTTGPLRYDALAVAWAPPRES